MSEQVIRVLLIEDTVAEAKTIQSLLKMSSAMKFEVDWVSSLTDGLRKLAESSYDVVLSDLQLPEGYGLETFRMVQDQARDLPILLLTNIEDDTVARRALAAGAQDYLIKSQIDSKRLKKALLYGIERHKLVKELRDRYESRISELQAV